MKKALTKHCGVAAIEFAFLLFPLIFVAFGITEFGRAMFQYDTLTKSVRNAARYLSTQAPGMRYAEARCLAVYGNDACSGDPLVPGLATSMVNICDAQSCVGTHRAVSTGSGAVNLVTVTIGPPATRYPFVSIVPFVVPDIDFGPIGVTMRQIA